MAHKNPNPQGKGLVPVLAAKLDNRWIRYYLLSLKL